MDEKTIKQIEAVLNGMQAEVNALKGILQTEIGNRYRVFPDRTSRIENLRSAVEKGIQTFTSYGGTAEDDAPMKERMHLFAFDFFDEIQAAYEKDK
jgi:hypothetical protein